MPMLKLEENRNIFLLIILGLLFGLLVTFSPGFGFFICFYILIILAIRYFLSYEERRFLIRVFIAGIALRILLLLVVTFIYSYLGKWAYQPDNMRAIAVTGDSALYTVRSWWILQHLSGEPISEIIFNVISNPYGHSAYLYLMSLFYYFFGFSPVSVTLINCTVSVLTGVVFYFIAKEISSLKAARIVLFLVVFFPSLIMWSIVNLKDSVLIFLTSLILWMFMKFTISGKYRYLISFIITALIQFAIRAVLLIPTIFISYFYFLIIRKRKVIILISLIALLIAVYIFKDDLPSFREIFIVHSRGVYQTGGFVYPVFDEKIYDQNFADFNSLSNLYMAKALFKAAFHFFFEPFPWRVFSLSGFLSLPQMLIWYILLLFAAIGMLMQLRYNWRKSLFFIAYFVVVGIVLVVGGGNVGTDFRMRDILTPIIILFASIGICNTFCSRHGRQKKY